MMRSAHASCLEEALERCSVKIARVVPHRVEMPPIADSSNWSSGKSVLVFNCTIVGIEIEYRLVDYKYAKRAQTG